MCGIAVAIDWEGAETAVGLMTGGIIHRGDITDPIISPRTNTAMGTRRLRIVDREHAIQPQLSFDNRLLVSFNGEIYNHAELRRELAALGVPFRTQSDTEVVANALQVWGAGALRRFNGMFAFVAFDMASGEFLAARDPFGVKPLYVVQSATGFLFCSEIKPLLAASESGDVMLLPPGYLLTRKVCAKYKSAIEVQPAGTSDGDDQLFDDIMAKAVQSRVPADLPFAVQLSGGIDSTLIAHFAREIRPDVPCYFLGNPDVPDYRYARDYADMTGADFRVVPFDAQGAQTLASLPDVVATTESFEPNVIQGAVCSYFAAQAIHKDGFRVALCGEGADELFCGYLPLEVGFVHGEEIGRAVRQDTLAMMARTCLQRIDRAPMHFQLEVREPFLDPVVVNYALSLKSPALFETAGGTRRGKKPLRALYDLHTDKLPQSIRHRSKVAFDAGVGLREGSAESAWRDHFEQAISDADFRDGQREFADYDLRTKEELFYLRHLAATMDVSRVPHLKDRTRLVVPFAVPGMENLRKVA